MDVVSDFQKLLIASATKDYTMLFKKWVFISAIFVAAGCAGSPKENIQIQPPPKNDIGITQDSKRVGSLIGTTVIRGNTYYIFNLTEPFCFQYNANATNNPRLPVELNQFRDTHRLFKKDTGTFCATGNIVFVLIPETKQMYPLITREEIDKLMRGK